MGLVCRSSQQRYDCKDARWCFYEFKPGKPGKFGCSGGEWGQECTTEGCSDLGDADNASTSANFVCCCRANSYCNGKWIRSDSAATDATVSFGVTDFVFLVVFVVLAIFAACVCVFCILRYKKRRRIKRRQRKKEAPDSSPTLDRSWRSNLLKTMIPDDEVIPRTPVRAMGVTLFVLSLEMVFTLLAFVFYWVPHDYQCCVATVPLPMRDFGYSLCDRRQSHWMFLPLKNNFHIFLKHLMWFLPLWNVVELVSCMQYIRLAYFRISDHGRMLLYQCGMNIVMGSLWVLGSALNLWLILDWFRIHQRDCRPYPALWIAACSFGFLCAVFSLIEVGALFWLLFEKKKIHWKDKFQLLKQEKKIIVKPSGPSSQEDSSPASPSGSSLKSADSGEIELAVSGGRFCSVQPEELQFEGLSPDIQSKELLLTNLSTRRHIVFKILTNQPKCYVVSPNTGSIAPKAQLGVEVQYRSDKDVNSSSSSYQRPHGFLVLAAPSTSTPSSSADVLAAGQQRVHVPVWFFAPSRFPSSPERQLSLKTKSESTAFSDSSASSFSTPTPPKKDTKQS